MSAPTVIPDQDGHVKTVCAIGQGAQCCAFLVVAGADGFSCAKGSDLEDVLRARVAAGLLTARGDNCGGPPDFAVTS